MTDTEKQPFKDEADRLNALTEKGEVDGENVKSIEWARARLRKLCDKLIHAASTCCTNCNF